ncbi:MAG TPA: carbamoyltransferase C-terminal domain-containing protein [Vineibacter sp.]|nr:carbamoyltransferase C-terminal domain-containing protein [Vineibacter sp.]
MTYILGLNAFHADSAACLVKDGELIAAAEEERFRRIKHWGGFPSEAIRYCLSEAKIDLDEVAHVAINRDSRANLWRKIAYVVARRPSVDLVMSRMRNRQQWADVRTHLADSLPDMRFSGEVHQVEHHLCHLASAFLVSPFDSAVAVSVDGFGDFASASWGIGEGNHLSIDGRVHFPHSLGIFYEGITQFIGFPHYGDEYKVMGLAPYGEPAYLDQMRRLVNTRSDGSFSLDLRYYTHAKEGSKYEVRDGTPSGGRIWSAAMTELLGPARDKDEPLEQRHKDLARSAQAMYEEAFFNLLGALHRHYGRDAVVLSGGCAYNSVANGKLYERSPFKRCYIQSAGGDAGGAIGAAFHTWHSLPEGRTAKRSFVMDHAYWGPSATSEEIAAAMAARQADIDAANCTVEVVSDEEALCRRTAAAIADGKVIGWFQGRLEWGPRALGNRSILADPRRADMKDILNLKIKRRESFRPFAPSILREAVPDWFETDDDVPFMMQVFRIRPARQASIPAVTHVDGSGRLQTVTRQGNARYHRLIAAFGELTGVPIVLNTSFNENEPVVCKPEEALDCFLRTKMDVLVLGDTLITRRD